MVTVWSNNAKRELIKAFEYIALESPQNAQMVVETIVDYTISLAKSPLRHPIDRYKVNNDGSWRAFEKYHYRITYRITDKEVQIVRFRYTRCSPLYF